MFADPPYAVGRAEVAGLLRPWSADEWLAPDAVVVVERSTRSPEPACVRRHAERGRRYGETTLWYVRAMSATLAERVDR